MDKEKIKGLMHLIAGLIVLFHGFDSFESGDFKSASAYLGFAILYMLVAGLHRSIIKRFLQADTAFFLLEAITILYSAWHYKTLNHLVLYYLLAAAGLTFIVLSLSSVNDADKPRRKNKRKRRKRNKLFDDVEKSNEPDL